MLAFCQEYYLEEVELLETLHGINTQSAMSIIAEISVSMQSFATALSLVGWAGLRPQNDESSGEIKGRKTLHGNV